MLDNNRFDAAKLEILAIAHRDLTTFEIAAVTWAKETNQEGYTDELLAWMKHVKQLEATGGMGEYFTAVIVSDETEETDGSVEADEPVEVEG